MTKVVLHVNSRSLLSLTCCYWSWLAAIHFAWVVCLVHAMVNVAPSLWRDEILQRRETLQQCHVVETVLLNVVIGRAQSTYLLSAKERYGLECLCSQSVLPLPARIIFRRWLALHENGRGTIFKASAACTMSTMLRMFNGISSTWLLLEMLLALWLGAMLWRCTCNLCVNHTGRPMTLTSLLVPQTNFRR